MADTVTSQTLTDTSGVKTVIKFTNSSDGTGESLVNKVDASELTHLTEDGTKVISKINWSINTADSKSGVEIKPPPGQLGSPEPEPDPGSIVCIPF